MARATNFLAHVPSTFQVHVPSTEHLPAVKGDMQDLIPEADILWRERCRRQRSSPIVQSANSVRIVAESNMAGSRDRCRANTVLRH